MHPDAVHVAPSGQQCSRSGQQTAFGRGQQPYSVRDIRQHVWPSRHSFPSGQMTFRTFSKTKILNQVTSNIITITDSRRNIIISKENLCVGIQINILRCSHSQLIPHAVFSCCTCLFFFFISLYRLFAKIYRR